METLCISIGITNYSESHWLPPLNGSIQDALWFAKIAHERGVPHDNIKTILNSAATRSEILSVIRRWPREANFKKPRVLLFFSGHGMLAKEGPLVSVPLLLPYDASFDDPISTSIRFFDLFQALKSVSPSSVFCFFDACQQDVGSLILSSRELEEVLESVQTSEKRCFFAAIANDRGITVEGNSGAIGEFSIHLFESIEELERQQRTTVAALADMLANKMNKNAKLNCNVALIGAPHQWLFQDITTNGYSTSFFDLNRDLNNYYVRKKVLQNLTHIIRRRSYPVIVIRGPSSSGKTVILKQLIGIIPRTAYFSIVPGNYNAAQMIELCIASIASEHENIFPSGQPGLDTKSCLESIKRSGGACVMWDHLERVPANIVNAVFEELVKYNIIIVAATNVKNIEISPQHVVVLTPLSREEIAEWISSETTNQMDDVEYIFKITGGNPLKLRRFLDGDQTILEAYKPSFSIKILRILALTGGFADSETFARSFGISVDTVYKLDQSPLINNIGRWKQPHDILVTGVTNFSPVEITLAAQYLALELGDDNSLLVPAIRLFDLAKMLSELDNKWDDLLCHALIRLSEKHQTSSVLSNLSFISSAATVVPNSLAECLQWCAERGFIDEFDQLLSANVGDAGKQCRIVTASARAAWWKGDFYECIRLAKIAQSITTCSEQINTAYLEEAIGHFFLGNWNEAMSVLESLSYNRTAPIRVRYWARMMSGTITGIRGQGARAATGQIVNAAHRLMEIGDLIGAAIGFGNAGEISWKNEQYLEANWELEKGLELARLVGARINEIEIIRGRLHVEMRTSGPFSDKSSVLYKELLSFITSSISSMEKMQIMNSLATFSILCGNLEQAKSYIEQAREFVLGNREYEIYWRWNCAILAACENNQQDAVSHFERGLELARQGDNRLAVKQLVDDIKLVSYNTNAERLKNFLNTVEGTLK